MYNKYTKFNFLTSPVALIQFAMGTRSPLHNIILKKAGKELLGSKYDKVLANTVISEIESGDFIEMNKYEGKVMHGNRPTYLFGKFLYFIVRMAQPETMIETGVAHGMSSWTILNAMHKNKKGKLYSIDLPNYDLKVYNVENFTGKPGWVVPDILRERWELQLGASEQLLPALKKKLGSIDIFFHDSDHSYKNIYYECAETFDAVKKDGLFICDDAHQNMAFEDFVNEKKIHGVQFANKGAAAVKRSQ